MNELFPHLAPPPARQDAAGWFRLFLCLAQSGHRLEAMLTEAAGGDGLTAPEAALLAGVAELGNECRQSDLVHWLGQSAAQVSGLVERLRQKALLQGRRLADDRRCQCWGLTQEGAAAFERVRRRWEDRLAEEFAGTVPGGLLENLAPLLGASRERTNATQRSATVARRKSA